MSLFEELNKKIVFVVGGASGIGAAIVETFRNEGAVVVNADYLYENRQLVASQENYWQVHLDVANEATVEQVVSQLVEHSLVPDIFVEVAGISTMDFLTESQTNDFDRVFAVNTRGVYLTSKLIVREMQKQHKKGRVIIIASQAGKNPYRGMSAYVASKHAVIGLTKTLALEVAKDQILVNAVCPGIIETKMKHTEREIGGQLRNMTAEEVLAEDISQVPIGRTGQPQDVANVVLFLASPLASYMTGQAINVTGGMTMH
ncbi:oxidoreductase [Enterococcus sp. JM4C]|uniref:SDR family NAD(P)-dependent oxidoreductase n=1 Tax=Candidatus Enterococcus huntleyi TaxID=1857217 RepID=UPI00137B7435|nr:SDR family NAD(P)-dependent oxidoreductase [Enterococcus sp. JM4C]KAF1295561.1 oxidoreductase [Enterococcus sp. JM4C]